MNTDTMTVEEMAAALGYTQDRDGDWLDEGGPVVCRWRDDRWASWPDGLTSAAMVEHPTERAAMSRLYALRFPESTPRRLEDLSVDELAALCGLNRNQGGGWTDESSMPGTRRAVLRMNQRWAAFPDGIGALPIAHTDSDREALLGLAKHLKVQPTTPPTSTPIVEPAPVQRPAMTPAKALSFIEAFSPCAHTSHTKVGFDHYVRCEDCETVVPSERLPDARKRAEDFNAATDVLHRLIAGKQVAEPAPVQRGGNVALVMRAIEAWRASPSHGVGMDAMVEAEFMRLLAEAYVADAKEGA